MDGSGVDVGAGVGCTERATNDSYSLVIAGFDEAIAVLGEVVIDVLVEVLDVEVIEVVGSSVGVVVISAVVTS